jgi:enoyl-CoA hydratase/carnithine racemase
MDSSDLKVVRYDIDGGVALVTLDRPERLNAWTGRMHTEYRWVLAEAERDDNVRVIVVTGAGRAFCAGADTAALDGHVERGAYDAGVDTATLATPGYGVRAEFDHSFAFHYGIPKPVIAAINGPAAGVGLVLACYCDIRYAATGAKLTTSNGRLGLPAEYGLSWVLPRLVGIGHAADLLFSSRVVLAEEAAPMGLVNRVVSHESLLTDTLDYAHTLAREISPSSLRESKRQLYTDLHRDVGSAVEESEQLLERMATEPDFREGVAAWQERRPPRF